MRKTIFWILISLLSIVFTGCDRDTVVNQDHIILTTENLHPILDTAILIPVEIIDSDYFPCNDCHSELEPNSQRRELVDMHNDLVFDHDSENRWCLACHNTIDRDSLVLAGGKLLGFNE